MIINNFTYKLPNNRTLFNHLTTSFSDNKVNVILGPNGEGKTTLLDFIAGANHQPSGVFINFPNFHQVAYQMQGVPFIAEATVFNTIKMIKNIENPNNNFVLSDLPDNLRSIANTKFGELSGGQRRLVIIHGICNLKRQLYLFDEPDSGLDPENSLTAMKNIIKLNQKGKKVIMTSHQFQNIGNKHFNLLFLKDGKIRFNGTPDEFLNASKSNNLVDAFIHENNILD